MYKLSRYLEFNHLFEHFFLAAVVSIIGIRFYLHVSGYPQIGSGDLHIAHMLWGGLLLMFALLGSLIFLNNDAKHVWAIMGGAGFGTFIDEMGKFVTNDNNYFYQPTFAIIYLVFIGIYLVYRNLWSRRGFSPDEYLVNSVEELKEVITKEMDQDELDKAIKYISLSDPHHKLTKYLKRLYSDINDVQPSRPGIYTKLRTILAAYYYSLISHRLVVNLIVLFFVIRSADFIFRGGDSIVTMIFQPFPETVERLLMLKGVLPMINFVALLLQAGLTIVGALQIRRSKITAYRYFRNSLLVSIFFLQVFNFYQDPVSALAITLREVLLLVTIEYFISRELEASPEATLKKGLSAPLQKSKPATS